MHYFLIIAIPFIIIAAIIYLLRPKPLIKIIKKRFIFFKFSEDVWSLYDKKLDVHQFDSHFSCVLTMLTRTTSPEVYLKWSARKSRMRDKRIIKMQDQLIKSYQKELEKR